MRPLHPTPTPFLPLLFALLSMLVSCHHATVTGHMQTARDATSTASASVPFEPFEVRVLPTINVTAERQPGRVRVPRKNTPLTVHQIMMALHDGHVAVYGYPPSRRRLAGAIAQVRAENGNGLKIYNFNLGNIGLAPTVNAPYYHYGAGIFLVFSSVEEGALAYWRTAGKCTAAMLAFEHNDPVRAAYAFSRCGYHTTPPDEYAKVLRPLYWSSHNYLEAT